MMQTEGAITEVNYDGDNVASVIGGSDAWHFLQDGLDSPLMAWYTGTGTPPRMVYFVTDGNGRQYAVGDTVGNWDGALYGNTNSTISGWTQGGGVTAGASYHAGRQGSGTTPQISFFRNRLYDQRTGKWTQEDPMGIGGGINLYQYNGNNPVGFSDPFGLCRQGTKEPDCKSLNAAARQGMKSIYRQSVRNNREYGAELIRLGPGRYRYNKAATGSTASVSELLPVPWTRA